MKPLYSRHPRDSVNILIKGGILISGVVFALHYTVEPPITDSLRYRLPPYNGQTLCPRLIFAIEIQSPRDRQTPISGQRTENMPPKDK